MPEALEPLSADARMTDGDYPGVQFYLGDDWRLVVNMDGKHYRLQSRQQTSHGELWMTIPGRAHKSLSSMVAKYCNRVPGLAEACAGLPEQPDVSVSDFQMRRAALLAIFDATDWRRNGYGRVICRDGNMRVVVEPCGTLYRLQWMNQSDYLEGCVDDWRTRFISPSAAAVGRYMDDMVFTAPCPKLRAFVVEMPALTADGSWPALPERPPSAYSKQRAQRSGVAS